MVEWSPKTWEEYQQVYLRLEKQDANRLNISSWLGGLTLTAFAALAATSPAVFELPILDYAHLISLLIAGLLAIATLIFLTTAMSAYRSIRHLARLSQTSLKNLEDNRVSEEAALADLEKLRPILKRPKETVSDAELLEKAWHIHDAAAGSITKGLFVLVGALVCIALEINILVFLIAICCLIYIYVRLSYREKKGTRFL